MTDLRRLSVAAALAVSGCLVSIDRDKIGAAADPDASLGGAAGDASAGTSGSAGAGGSAGASGSASGGTAGGSAGSPSDAGQDASPPPCLDTDPKNTIVCPGESIQEAVDANGFAAEITIKAGLHRLQTVAPKSGNIFSGEPGAVLSGAKLLTDFQRQGNLWFASGQTQGGDSGQETCYTGTGNEAGLFKAWPRCNYPEDLYFDDVPLRHVAALADVAPGTWYFDYEADRIYFADDPTGKKVETSVTRVAIDGVNKGPLEVVVRGLVIEKYAGIAISISNCKDWKIENNEIRLNHGPGVNGGPSEGLIILGNRIHDNGAGIALWQPSTALIEDNEIARNAASWPGYTQWHGFGVSTTGAQGLVFKNNRVVENGSHGLHLNSDNDDYRVENNRFEQNQYNGIHVRSSCAGILTQNQVHKNGTAGIAITRSRDVEVFANTLSENGAGFFPTVHPWANPYQIHLSEDVQVYPGQPCTTIENVSIHDNASTVTGALGAVDAKVATGSSFVNNTYDLRAASSKPFRLQGTLQSEQEWVAGGRDATGTFLR
jgi:parallel beta-helix repeat protein